MGESPSSARLTLEIGANCGRDVFVPKLYHKSNSLPTIPFLLTNRVVSTTFGKATPGHRINPSIYYSNSKFQCCSWETPAPLPWSPNFPRVQTRLCYTETRCIFLYLLDSTKHARIATNILQLSAGFLLLNRENAVIQKPFRLQDMERYDIRMSHTNLQVESFVFFLAKECHLSTEDNLKRISCVWMWARISEGAFLDHEKTTDTTIHWYSTNSSIQRQNIHRWNRIFSHQSQDKQLVQTKCKMTVASGDCRLLIESRSLKYKNRTRAENNREIPLKECFCAIPNAHLSLTTKDLSKSSFHGLLLGYIFPKLGTNLLANSFPRGAYLQGNMYRGVHISEVYKFPVRPV